MTVTFTDILSSGAAYYDVDDTVVENLTDIFESINNGQPLETALVFDDEQTNGIVTNAFTYGQLQYRLQREIYVVTDPENRYLLAYDSEQKAKNKKASSMYKYVSKTIDDRSVYLDEYDILTDIEGDFVDLSSFTERQNMICWSCIEFGKQYEQKNPDIYGVFTVYDNLAAIYATKDEAENSVSSDGYVDKIQLSDIN